MNELFARMWVLLHEAGVPVTFEADEREVLARYLAWRVDAVGGCHLSDEEPGLLRMIVPDFAPGWRLVLTLDLGGKTATPHCPFPGLSQTLTILGRHSCDLDTLTMYRHLDLPHPFLQEDLDDFARILLRQWRERLGPRASKYGYW